MTTTKKIIAEWIESGLEKKATHMIVVCDTFDHTDYPVYVFENQNARQVASSYSGENMQIVMEVYNLSLPIEQQLNESRSFNY